MKLYHLAQCSHVKPVSQEKRIDGVIASMQSTECTPVSDGEVRPERFRFAGAVIDCEPS